MIERLVLPRLLSSEAASEQVGMTAPPLAPNLALDTIVTDADTGEPVLAYLPLTDPGPFRRAVLQIDCSNGVQRNNNYRSRTRTFGYAPRRPVTRREACWLSSLGLQHPDIEAVLDSYTGQFAAALDTIDPAIRTTDTATLSAVRDDWRIGDTKLWTSGVVNDSTALPYHRDGFNFPTWSAMPVLRRGVRGGHLHLPEYGIVLPCADATVTYFCGQRFVHGVTPLERVRTVKDGYRISVVYYALRGMKNCLEAAEETRLGRRTRTKRETDMAERLANGDTSIPGQKPGREVGRQAMASWRGTGSGGGEGTTGRPRQ